MNLRVKRFKNPYKRIYRPLKEAGCILFPVIEGAKMLWIECCGDTHEIFKVWIIYLAPTPFVLFFSPLRVTNVICNISS
jgi:hypothetical protein